MCYLISLGVQAVCWRLRIPSARGPVLSPPRLFCPPAIQKCRAPPVRRHSVQVMSQWTLIVPTPGQLPQTQGQPHWNSLRGRPPTEPHPVLCGPQTLGTMQTVRLTSLESILPHQTQEKQPQLQRRQQPPLAPHRPPLPLHLPLSARQQLDSTPSLQSLRGSNCLPSQDQQPQPVYTIPPRQSPLVPLPLLAAQGLSEAPRCWSLFSSWRKEAMTRTSHSTFTR